VGLEFLETFLKDDPDSDGFFAPGVSAEKRQFDLPGYVLQRIAAAGVPKAEWTGHDTCADEARFFSNRRAFKRGEADYGRLLSAIMLEEGSAAVRPVRGTSASRGAGQSGARAEEQD
jgi:copper oxidase (laccase) domain-containing protein